ncbi:hypothetical protein PCC7418_2942 [Halothece sp. PCC 7418]|uniref:hypothetical protein n=1 Tax=Halothece sp. (strain PCC 7418) TaxID=65093 RepID=UPI0002A07643|nr:hypothetical protein [Halothece sp. PCC 7418]AFZ45071.1 hypothetical protein PCC7418_2942 [Halothece sp. PCC 7418]
MNPPQDNEDQQKREQDNNLQREIVSEQRYSLASAIAREGGNFLKGESPVPKLVQVTTEINLYIDRHLPDSSGALQAVLKRWVKSDSIVSQHLDSPLTSLEKIIDKILQNQELFYEMVRQADLKWGQMYEERPYFQKPGDPPHPEDEYSHESVREKLAELRQKVASR